MRTTKTSQKGFIRKLTAHVKAELARVESDNVSVYAPHVTDEELNLLRQEFKLVKREFLGYIRFEI